MFRKTISAIVVVVGLILVMPWPVFSITYERCQEIEKEKVQVRKEIAEGEEEMKSAFRQRQYDKVKALRNSITELRKRLVELRKTDTDCREASKPEEVKKSECEKIKRELLALDTDEQQSEEQIKKIDELYRRLLRCNEEWRRMVSGPE